MSYLDSSRDPNNIPVGVPAGTLLHCKFESGIPITNSIYKHSFCFPTNPFYYVSVPLLFRIYQKSQIILNKISLFTQVTETYTIILYYLIVSY